MKKYDVGIIGDGPAALAAAIVLAKSNFNVVLFGKSNKRPSPREFGETLNLAVRPALNELGVLPLFQRLALPRIVGSVSSWGRAETDQTSALFHPLGFGWLLQKQSFKDVLWEQAKRLGATLSDQSVQVAVRNGRGWEVSLADRTIRSNWIVIATGRDNFGLEKSSSRIVLDKLVACTIIFEDRTENSNSICVDSSEEGWFFSIKLDSERRLLSYFTDGDLVNFRTGSQFVQMLNLKAPMLPAVSGVFRYIDPAVVRSFSIVSANSSFRPHIFSEGAMFCGDSAQTFDPLSSQGVCEAIVDGIEIGKVMRALQCGKNGVVVEHEKNRRERYVQYLRNWCRIYSTEQRWGQNVFWQRRQHLQMLRQFIDRMETVSV